MAPPRTSRYEDPMNETQNRPLPRPPVASGVGSGP